jgi:hypothetical protein
MARWLTQQLHRRVESSQILLFPEVADPADCTITRTGREPIGATSLSLRCPAHALPQLVLLNFPADVAASHAFNLSTGASRNVPPLVRTGAALSADWRTDTLHAQLPVVALDSGAAGDEIRVRITQTNRIMRARILSAHTVTIVAGA